MASDGSSSTSGFPYLKLENFDLLNPLNPRGSNGNNNNNNNSSSISRRSLLSSSFSDESASDTEDDDCCNNCNFLPGLSWTERLIGCATCMVAGYLLSFGSFFRIKELVFGNPFPFVIHVTLGNVIALCGSCFLKGAKSQVKSMWNETRRTVSICYVSSLLFTIIVAFLPIPSPPKGLILLLLVLCQYVFITWYCLSYIPYARETVLNCCKRHVVEPTMDRFSDTI